LLILHGDGFYLFKNFQRFFVCDSRLLFVRLAKNNSRTYNQNGEGGE